MKPNERGRFFARHTTSEKTPVLAEVTARQTGDVATLRLYDVIDSWGGPYGVSAKEFAAALDELPDTTSEIRLHINSPGGEVWDGLAILNALRQHPARVVTVVDGIAASAASFVAMAGDEVLVAPNAELMVHDAWGLCVGNATDMAKMAADLGHESDNIANVYARKAGGTTAEWRDVMAAETWFSAEEAVAARLADRVLEDAPPADAAKAQHDLRVFNYAGRREAPTPTLPSALAGGRKAPAAAGGPTPLQEETMSDTLLDGLRQQLGLDATADEATVLAANAEALAERAETPTGIPDGHVVIPAAALADLQAGAAAGSAAAERLRVQDRAEFLDSVRTKYAPSNREAWEKEYDRDPAGTRAHFDKAPELVPVAEIGRGTTDDELADKAVEDRFAAAGLAL